MLKNLSLKILFALFSLLSFSQDPVKWSTSVKKINDITFQLNTKAEIEDNWRLYSQNLDDGEKSDPAYFGQDVYNHVNDILQNLLAPYCLVKFITHE